ncbi:NlpC/P60 family protein [Streptomyces sp. NPDC056254]|uniref:C40 family peptidase n=1 Tax=Streptomyces sp. NPDC056254 TaxID=3345763 RepID=UPI0035DF97FD
MHRPIKRVLIMAGTLITCIFLRVGGIVPEPAFAEPNPTGQESTQKGTLEEVRQTLDALYRQAEAATDAYNLAEGRATKQAKRIADLSKQMKESQTRLAHMKVLAGAHARAQYRAGSLPFQVQLFLQEHPTLFLESLGRGYEANEAIGKLLEEIARTHTDLHLKTQKANAYHKSLHLIQGKRAAAKKEIEQRIADAKGLEASLKEQERLQLERLQQESLDKAQAAWLSSGIAGAANDFVSNEAKQALMYATAQIGKPYEWGAEGPGSYDCSGLTSEAWKSAGVPMPRTSQEQWAQLTRVKLEEMRPGDLIIYNPDATHVGMYIGDGKMVHAPRPGRHITLAGAGTMPILGVVRPRTA